MIMTPMIESFVFHFGEMGSRWGFNRTVGQMVALIVISEESLTAAAISEALGISRGNVSMGLKELQSWRLITVHHVQGDRKDYYKAAGSIWELARRVMEERKKREVDPTLSLLRDTLLETPANDREEHAQTKMREIHDLLEVVDHWSDEIQTMSTEKLQTLVKVGTSVGKVLEFTERFLPGSGKTEK